MSRKLRRKMVTIVTLLVLLIGSVNIIAFATRTLNMAVDLAIISDNINYYNESEIKTDEWTDEAKETIEYRENNFYQSNDWWTRTFSQMFWMLKVLVVIVMISTYVIIPYMWLSVLAFFLERRRRQLSRRKSR